MVNFMLSFKKDHRGNGKWSSSDDYYTFVTLLKTLISAYEPKCRKCCKKLMQIFNPRSQSMKGAMQRGFKWRNVCEKLWKQAVTVRSGITTSSLPLLPLLLPVPPLPLPPQFHSEAPSVTSCGTWGPTCMLYAHWITHDTHRAPYDHYSSSGKHSHYSRTDTRPHTT